MEKDTKRVEKIQETMKKIDKFINSQKSIHLYPKVQKSLKKVLEKLSDEEYKKVTHNLILMVLHEGALGQVMHFPQKNGKFKILQLSVARKIPITVLNYIVAHELGHVLQDRNWEKSDGQKLEKDADESAERWGFPRTKKIDEWYSSIKS